MIEQREWLALPGGWIFCLSSSYHGLALDVHLAASLTPLLPRIFLLEQFFILISVGKTLWSVLVGEQFRVDYDMLVAKQDFLLSALRAAFIYFRFVSYCATNSMCQMKYAHIGMCVWTLSLHIKKTLRIDVFLVLWDILLEENFLDATGQERTLYTGLSVCVPENKLQYICWIFFNRRRNEYSTRVSSYQNPTSFYQHSMCFHQPALVWKMAGLALQAHVSTGWCKEVTVSV